jgi:uncharacterized SAM-binding protein YcdF (DUF218 family)
MATIGLVVVGLALGLVAIGHRSAWPSRQRWPLATGIVALLLIGLALLSGSYELRKIVGECLMPAGLVWLGLAGLAVALWRRRHRGLALAATALWGAYSLAGNVVLGGWMLSLLERPFAGVDPLREGRFDAVLVLGGGVSPREDGEASLTSAGDRVVLAARMFRAGLADTLVTSGPMRRLPDGRVVSDPALTAALWTDLGVPVERTVKIEGPSTTTDEIPAFRELVRARGWRRVGLITSAWHLRRALRLAGRAGLTVAPLPADRHEYRPFSARWLLPQEAGFREVQFASWEVLGALAGR